MINDLAIAANLAAQDGIVVADDFFCWAHPQITVAVLRYQQGLLGAAAEGDQKGSALGEPGCLEP